MNQANKSFAGENESSIAPCGIHVNVEGDWYHEGKEIIRADILELFYESLHRTSQGELIIEWKGSRCRIESEDTPFVVARVDRSRSKDGAEEIRLRLRHIGKTEPLDPASLEVGKENVLYCRVRNGSFPARFSRPAYYQLADWIEEDAEKHQFYLDLNGRRYLIKGA